MSTDFQDGVFVRSERRCDWFRPQFVVEGINIVDVVVVSHTQESPQYDFFAIETAQSQTKNIKQIHDPVSFTVGVIRRSDYSENINKE